MNTTKDPAAEPGPQQEIEELLPWHAAGTLSRRDAKRVEDALARDPALARRYDMVREEMIETIGVNETLGAPSVRTMDALFKKIDAEPARQPMPRMNLAARLGEFVASLTPRTLAFSAAAAALALLLQAGIITGVLLNKPSGGFQTASAPSATPADGSYAMIRFAPASTAADITKFLEANKLSLAGGPAPGGMYRVRLAATGTPKTEITRIVKQLQQDKTVEFIAAIE
jgi:anti-sigma factor RsiW